MAVLDNRKDLRADKSARKIFVTFPEGKQKAFTMSYDDGDDSDIRMVELMRRYGVKGTFHINSGLCPQVRQPHGQDSWERMTMEECIELYGEDMEVAIHGATHAYWNKLPSPQAMLDIIDDRRKLERATGRIIRGASYPYGGYHDGAVELLKLADIQYCRTIETTGKTVMDRDVDWLRFRATCTHNDPALMSYAREFVERIPKKHLHLFCVWGHSFEFVRDSNWERLESLLQLVCSRRDIWYATLIEIAEYCIAGKRLVYNLDETLVRNPTDIDLWLCIQPAGHLMKIPAGSTMKLLL